MPIHLPSSIPIRIPFVSERGFNFITPIRITNRTTKLTDYQIEVNLNTSNFAFEKALCDGADIRFQDANGDGLSYWIESWTSTSAKIWVKLNELEDYEERFLYMVYGNYDVVDYSNGTNTFLFYDGFPGSSIDTNKWDGDTGYASVSGGIMTYQSPSWEIMYSKLSWQYPIALRIWCNYGSSNNEVCGLKSRTDISWIRINGIETVGKINCIRDGTGTELNSNVTFGDYAIYDIKWKSDIHASFHKNGIEMTNSPITTYVPNENNLAVAFSTDDGSIATKWILVRKYVSPEPLVEIL